MYIIPRVDRCVVRQPHSFRRLREAHCFYMRTPGSLSCAWCRGVLAMNTKPGCDRYRVCSVLDRLGAGIVILCAVIGAALCQIALAQSVKAADGSSPLDL